MSPTRSNKCGVRYRYYVSHAILQKRKAEAGSVVRVPAPEIEDLVLDGFQKHRASIAGAEQPVMDDSHLIERYVDSVTVKPQALEIRLVLASEASAPTAEPSINAQEPGQTPTTTIMLAWTAPSFAAVKGIVHALRKAGNEAREPRCSAHCNRQGPGLDRQHLSRSNHFLRGHRQA